MKVSIVLDVAYGDAGKGRVVDSLTDVLDKTLVVRFSGGHQAGHNVRHGDISHIFSNFGSGTLKGADTLWDEYCTFYPISFINEYNILKDKCDTASVKIFIHENSKICTPYDVLLNQKSELTNQHGSCGQGVGHTLYRHETEDHSYHIYARDLKYPWILKQKLLNIRQKFYTEAGVDYSNIDSLENEYWAACTAIYDMGNVILTNSFYRDKILFDEVYDHVIFEGSQGILLDRDFGVAFPNVTRSYTTYKNIIPYLNTYDIMFGSTIDINVYYVSRCYQTRHGNGPLCGEDSIDMEKYFNFSTETNQENQWQGKFRYAPILFDMIEYAIECNRSLDTYLNNIIISNIVYTCIDQYKNIQVPDTNCLEIPMVMPLNNISSIYTQFEILLNCNTPCYIRPDNIWFSNSNDSKFELYKYLK